MKKKGLAIAAAVLVLLIIWGGTAVFDRNFIIARRYDPQTVKTVWQFADEGFMTQLGQQESILTLLDAAAGASVGEAMSAYSAYEDELNMRCSLNDMTISQGMSVAAILRQQDGVFSWSKSAFQPEKFEALITWAAYSAEAYKPYCRMIAELVTDEAAYEAHGAAYFALLRAAVEAERLAATSLYQLVYRELFGYRDIRRDGDTRIRGFEYLEQEQQEDLLHLSQGDLWDQYIVHLKALWQTESRLETYYTQIAL